jgi:hypothetical protein
MKAGFTVLKIEATNPERGDIRVDSFRAAHKPRQNVRSYICRSAKRSFAEVRAGAHRPRHQGIDPAGEGTAPADPAKRYFAQPDAEP